MNATREAIAAALSVPGVIAGQPLPPLAPGPGQGWPVWVSTQVSTYCGFVGTWYAYATLPPADEQSAIEAADPLITTLWKALTDVGEVSLVEPVALAVADPAAAGAGLPALRFTLTVLAE